MNPRAPLPSDFLLQAEDLIARLDADLALLRRLSQERLRTVRAERRKIIERLFRSTHTLKGAAATFDDPLTARLAHEIENTLHALRLDSRASFSSALGEALQAAVDTISVHLRGRAETDGTGDAERHRAEIEATVDDVLTELETRTRELLSPGASQDASMQDASMQDASMQDASMQDANVGEDAGERTAEDVFAFRRDELPVEWQDAALDVATITHLRDAARDELNLFSLTFNFDLETFDDDYRRCEDTLREGGEIIFSRPLPLVFDAATAGDAVNAPPRIKFCLLYAASLEAADLDRALTDYEATVMPLLNLFVGNEEDDSPALSDELADEETSAALVRVSLDELDELVHLVAELHDDTRAQFSGGEGEASLSAMNDDLRRRFLRVQERLLRLRMIPIEPRLQEAARAGRVAARARGKQVEWKITGGDVQLDKALAEQLTAPLLHLVRNGVDHGIENPEARGAAGKPERGTISLQAEAHGGRVRVLVCDDGCGIDAERVRQRAIAQQIISPARQLKGEDHLRLIFRPGFTTAEADGGVAAVSGRGVGLDAAERAVRELGGELRVGSTRGSGTTFEMRLPLTLALMQAVVVGSGKHRYCIPAEQVFDAICFDRNGIISAADSPCLSWNGKSVPLVSLSSLLDITANPVPPDVMSDGEMSCALILRVDGRNSGIRWRDVVDEEDCQNCVAMEVDDYDPPDEILARGLGAHAPQWLGILGATVRPDGTTALLLDIAELINARK